MGEAACLGDEGYIPPLPDDPPPPLPEELPPPPPFPAPAAWLPMDRDGVLISAAAGTKDRTPSPTRSPPASIDRDLSPPAHPGGVVRKRSAAASIDRDLSSRDFFSQKKAKRIARCFLQPKIVPSSSQGPDRIRCTVIVENLSPFTDMATVKSGLAQLGTVSRIEMRRNPLQPLHESMGWAAVEMATADQADNAVYTASRGIFCLGGVPRPVTIRLATSDDGAFSTVTKSIKPMPRIVRDAGNDLVKLRNLHYQHFSQEAFLDRLQLEEINALQEQQLQTMFQCVSIHDDLTRYELQQQISDYRSAFDVPLRQNRKFVA